MTLSSPATAVVIGALLGLGGRWAVPTGRRVPLWVLLAVAIGAAVLGTVVGRLGGIDAAGISPVELILQLVFAGAAVSLAVATADRRPPDQHRYDVGTGSR